MSSSVNTKEVENFAKDSSHWWDEDGPFKPLHRLNPERIRYIKSMIYQHYGRDENALNALDGLSVLDIGCGGGLVCEPLARLGGNVTGVDADANAISVATDHAALGGLDITYKNGAAEDLQQTYDVVLALEVIEHVDNVEEFVENCVKLCAEDGLIIFSTLNRTPQSYALGIVAAEHILRWVPRGTHQWKKFLKPSELARMLRHNGAREHNITGLVFNPVKNEFSLSDNNTAVNYFLTAHVKAER